MEFSRQDTWVGCHSLLQGIFPTPGSNPGLLHCRYILYWLSHQRSPCVSPTASSRPKDAAQYVKKEKHYFANKFYNSKLWFFQSYMDVRDHKKGWALKNWCFWAVVWERTLESSIDCKEIKSVNPKGNQFLILIGRTDTESETLVLWPLHAKSQHIRKDSYAGKD